jgi:hypothetical protein
MDQSHETNARILVIVMSRTTRLHISKELIRSAGIHTRWKGEKYYNCTKMHYDQRLLRLAICLGSYKGSTPFD